MNSGASSERFCDASFYFFYMTNTTTFKWFPILGFEHLYEVREDGEQVRSKAQTLRVGDKIKHKPVILLKKDRRGCYTLRKRNGEKNSCELSRSLRSSRNPRQRRADRS